MEEDITAEEKEVLSTEEETPPQFTALSVEDEAQNLVDQISRTNTKEEFKAFYDKFKLNNIKKEVSLKNKFENLLDMVADEAINRVEEGAEGMTDKDLINYAAMAGNQAERLNKSIEEGADSIQDIRNTQMPPSKNKTVAALTRDQRELAVDLAYSILFGEDIVTENNIYEQDSEAIDAEFINNEDEESEENNE